MQSKIAVGECVNPFSKKEKKTSVFWYPNKASEDHHSQGHLILFPFKHYCHPSCQVKNPFLMSEQAQKKGGMVMPWWIEPITLDYWHEDNDFCFIRVWERPHNVALTCLWYWISNDNAVKNSSLAKEQHLSCACLMSGIMALYHRMLRVRFSRLTTVIYETVQW